MLAGQEQEGFSVPKKPSEDAVGGGPTGSGGRRQGARSAKAGSEASGRRLMVERRAGPMGVVGGHAQHGKDLSRKLTNESSRLLHAPPRQPGSVLLTPKVVFPCTRCTAANPRHQGFRDSKW